MLIYLSFNMVRWKKNEKKIQRKKIRKILILLVFIFLGGNFLFSRAQANLENLRNFWQSELRATPRSKARQRFEFKTSRYCANQTSTITCRGSLIFKQIYKYWWNSLYDAFLLMICKECDMRNEYETCIRRILELSPFTHVARRSLHKTYKVAWCTYATLCVRTFDILIEDTKSLFKWCLCKRDPRYREKYFKFFPHLNFCFSTIKANEIN